MYPFGNPLTTYLTENLTTYLSNKQQEEFQDLVPDFANILKQAKIDFAKFKSGESLFSKKQHDKIQEWFIQFPELWKGIRPNFTQTINGAISTHQQTMVKDADSFIKHINDSLSFYQPENIRLGLATIVIAGIIIAVTFGIGGVIWAIGYVKEQNNITNMIDEVTAGRLDPAILQQAINQSSNSPFDNVTDILKYGVIAAGLFLAFPLLSKIGSGR